MTGLTRNRLLVHVLGFALWLALLLPLPPASAQPVTLNFKEADLQAVIATVSEITGTNFVIDPRVKGKVTVISSEPMEAAAIYEVFLSILSVHGFAAVPGADGVVKIVPEVNARQSAIPTVNGVREPVGDQYVTRVIKVENVDAAQLVPLLRPLLPQQGHLAAYPPANMLIASAEAANIRRLADIITRIDRGGLDEFEVIRLENASATEVVRILQTIQGARQQTAAAAPTLVADERTNSIIVTAPAASRLRLRTLIAHLDTPLDAGGNTEVIYLRYANAVQIAGVLGEVSRSMAADLAQTGDPQRPIGQVTIQAEESTNALVITAPPAVMESLKVVIRQLDIRRAQVLVEAVIAEVSSDTARELGVQWAYDGQRDGRPVGVVNFGRSGSGLTGLLTDPPSISDGLNLIVGDTDQTGSRRFGAFIRALAGDADTNILSTPTLVTLDNQEAEIVVGQNVPFVTGSYAATGQGTTPTNPFQTIERRDVGITLRIRPQINEGDAVKLDVVQEVSSVQPAVSGAADLITNKRSIRTTVLVDDGDVLVLGGLIDDQLQEGVQKVPGLGDIPLLGRLFRYENTTKTKRNLMVFLHPVILRNSEQNAMVTGSKYTQIRTEQLRLRENGISLMRDDVSPLMPPWDEALTLPPPLPVDPEPLRTSP